MKKIFTFITSACFSVMLANAAAPTVGLVFDGDADGATGIVVANSATATELTAPTALTVEAWVKYSALGGGYIVCNEDNAPDGGWVLRLEGNKLDFSIGAVGVSWVHCTNPVEPPALDQWYHVAGVYEYADGAGQLRLYIDGALAQTTDFTAPMELSDREVVLGEGTAFTGRYLRGSVADVRIWSVVRTEAEIMASKDSYLTGAESGLYCNWKMNEGTGTAVADVKSQYNLEFPAAGVTWFGEPAGIENATAASVEVATKGQTLSIANNSEFAINFTLVNLAGVKVFDAAVKAGEKLAKATGLNGVFILKGVAEDGSTVINKVVLN